MLVLNYAPGMCSVAATCQPEPLGLSGLQPIDRVRLAPDVMDGELVAMFEALPHWPRVLRAYQRAKESGLAGDAMCARDGTGYNCSGLGSFGNVYWSPLLGYAGRPRPGTLRQLHSLHQCIELISEAERARGAPFGRLIHSRLEFHWLAPHPPLGLLDASYTWIPEGQDYPGGVNDRHAVLNRSVADVYFRRWDALISGDVMRSDPQLTNGDLDVERQAPENLLATTLAYHGVPLRRFPPVAFLVCCAGDGCFMRRCRPLRRGKRGTPTALRGKYPRELAAAAKYAQHVAEVGWETVLRLRNVGT